MTPRPALYSAFPVVFAAFVALFAAVNWIRR
jgi:hypothetical protein